MMEQIHNTKKRMPLILDAENARIWVSSGLEKEEIESLMKPIEASKMKAHTISRLVTSRSENSNVKEVVEQEKYEELPELVS